MTTTLTGKNEINILNLKGTSIKNNYSVPLKIKKIKDKI